MDLEDAPLAVLEPVPGAPEITRTGVCSNPSPIKHQHPKPNHAGGGEEESYRFTAGMQKQSSRMPMAARTTEGKLRTSYRPKLSPDGKMTRVVQFVYTISARRTMPRKKSKSSHSCVKLPDSSYKTGISFNGDSEIIPGLYSDEYEFDANEYQKWHLDYKFNLDAAASIINHKCENYASKDKSFLDLSAEDLRNKSIWMFPPIERAKEFLLHYEAIRLQQPDTMMAVICLPRLVTPGADYKNLVKKYKCIHTYPAGTYLFSKFVQDSPFERINIPTTCPYDLFLADEFISERENQSLHANQLNAIHESEIYKETLKYMFKSKNKEENDSSSDSDEEQIQFKPHQPRFLTPLCHVTTSSASDDLLIIQTPTKQDVHLLALVDSGATKNFCSDSYVRDKHLTTHPLVNPLRIRLADGSMSMARFGVNIEFNIGALKITQEFIMTRLSGQHQIILGYEFLKEFNPQIDWTMGTLRFSDMETVQAIISKRVADAKHLSGKQMARLLKKEVDRKAKSKTKSLIPEPEDLRTYIGTLKQIHTSTTSVSSLNAIQGYEDSEDVTAKISAIKTDFGPDYTSKLHKVLTEHSAALKPLLGLPVQRPDFDMHIDFDGPIPHSRVYRMSSAELEELKIQLKDYLERGWIRPSTSEFASGVLFAIKPGTNKLRMCTDYRRLNTYTKKIGFALPNIDNILDKLGHSKCFTALDLQSGFHQLRIKDYPDGVINSRGEEIRGSDIHKTAFCTQYGTFEYVVMPFGLAGAPSTYQRFVSSILEPIKRPWLQVYIDDILIFSNSPEEHLLHIEEVMSILAKNDLFIRSEKCQWMRTSLDYLGFTIQGSTNLASGGIKPSIKKIQAVTDWEIPKNVRHVQSFLGFTNFYRRFIRDYSSIASPLYNLTEKGKAFYWSNECNHAFRTLKKCLTTAPLLVTPRTGPDATFVISTDASNKGIGAVLLQEQPDGSLRPCSYYAKTLNRAQCKYPVYDQELRSFTLLPNPISEGDTYLGYLFCLNTWDT